VIPFLIILLGWSVWSSLLCHRLAVRKGRDPLTWALVGVVLGWVAVACLLRRPDAPPPDPETSAKLDRPLAYSTTNPYLQRLREMDEQREALAAGDDPPDSGFDDAFPQEVTWSGDPPSA